MQLFSSWKCSKSVAIAVLVAAFGIRGAGGGEERESSHSSHLTELLNNLVPGVLRDTQAPSASVVVIKDASVAAAKAYGAASIDPAKPATTSLRYGIGSVSKQFTAAALLLLAEEGKLRLDDNVAEFFPSLTRSNEITIRQLLSHTAGYRDNLPLSYVTKWMLAPTSAREIMETWAKKPLDFSPGQKFQYSNTDYVILGAILEKVSGISLAELLQKRIFTPLEMKSATVLSATTPSNVDVKGYERRALGPVREAPLQAPGWLFGAGELLMNVEDLAKWDISLIKQSLLKKASYKELEKEVLLNNGLGTRYALGLRLTNIGDHRELEHGGFISGFYSENLVLPEDRLAVAVCTNMSNPVAASKIANQIAAMLLAKPDPLGQQIDIRLRQVLKQLQHGAIDRAQFTADANQYFDERTLEDYAKSLAPLGQILSLRSSQPMERGGFIFRNVTVQFKDRALSINVGETKDGQLSQFLIE